MLVERATRRQGRNSIANQRPEISSACRGEVTVPEAEVEIALEGTALLTDPLLNKGMAFTEEERTAFGLHGLLPPHVATLHEQIERQLEAMRSYETALERHLFLCDVQDSNETLFYALVERNLKEMLPLVYTPTVGEACQHSVIIGAIRAGCS
jgi:malate dehydrogenase (oxaloacetate-decarboxylating)